MSEDFFFVRLSPKASFTVKSVESVEETPSSLPNVRVQGVFGLRGRGNDIEFLVTGNPPQDGKDIRWKGVTENQTGVPLGHDAPR